MHEILPEPSKSLDTFGRKTQLLTKLALTVVSLCLSIITLEFALRTIIPVDARNPPEFRFPHPVFGWALEPNASYRYHMPEDTVTVKYNSQGWHDVEHEINKPDGVFRILILGDSFMEAYSVEMEDGFHRRLEEFARTPARDTEVINLAVGGYGTLQEYLVFQEVGQLYAPDIVLLGFFDFNDMVDNSLELSLMLKPEGITTISRPYLDQSESRDWKVIPADFDAAQRIYKEQQAWLDAERNNLTERLVFLRLVRAGMNSLQNLQLFEKKDSTTASTANERPELALLGVNYCVEPAEYTRAWGITKRILAQLKEDVEAMGSKLVVFSIPALEEVSADDMEKLKSNLVYPEKLCMEEGTGNRRLSLILTELDIENINLLPNFRKVAREDGIQLYRIADLHWNEAGHALAAEQVAAELIKRGLLSTPRK